MAALGDIRHIAEIEFADIVVDAALLREKLRLFLRDGSFVDIWLSKRLADRFGFHWERRHLDGAMYRYDNFPDIAWVDITTYPRHFHNGSQNAVEAAPFPAGVLVGFRSFMVFVRQQIESG